MIRLALVLSILLTPAIQAGQNTFSIRGSEIYLNNRPTKIIGLRCSNALISDDTTQQLIDQLDVYQSYGLNTVSVFFMGSRYGDVEGYKPDASLDPVYAARMGRIIEAADGRGMVVLVGCLYWSDSRAKEDLEGVWKQADANKAIANTVRWLSEQDYRNVFVDVDNEGMAHKSTGWSIRSMIDAAHQVDPTIMVAYNNKTEPPSNSDLNIHHSPVVAGKPWLDSESTPNGFSYWGEYSKETFQKSGQTHYNYSRIGRYTQAMKDAQLAQTRDGIENHNGIMLASTWLQCPPIKGTGGPFVTPGGHSNIGDADKDIDALHPDAGVLWWLEYIKHRYSSRRDR